MKKLFKLPLLIMIIFLSALPSKAQSIKPSSSGYAPVNGIKVYYETYGEGMPIVLLHGAFYTIEMNWAQIIPELSKTRKVIALELQGHGHTPYSERKLEITTLASDVEGVMNHLKVESADVVGYSMGGSVAFQFAIQFPKRLKNLIIISSTYKTGGWRPEVAGALKNLKPEMFEQTPIKTGYDAVAPDKTKWTKFIEQMAAFAGQPFDLGEANIAKITSPVLLIAGDNDGIDKTVLIKTYQLLGGDVIGDFGALPKSQLAIVPGQSHVSVMMQTQAILNYMDSFLK